MPPYNVPPAGVIAEMSSGDLLAHLRDGSLVIVDVLPSQSYREAHIATAVSMPLEDLPSMAATVLPDRTRDIVVYCGSYT